MLLQQFQQHIKEHFNLQAVQTKFVIAVSGGVDSIVLTDLLFRSGFDFIIAHCNFKLRAEESERDETFVRSLETKYNKPVFVQQFNTQQYADENKLSIQETARNLRYNWFAELLSDQQKNETRKILLTTAHNANDNIETLLMHFFRGTGIHGLTAIPEKDIERSIIRPLLFAKREDIVAYANENNLQWVEDSSNTTDKYTRNFFRLQLIPSIKEIFSSTEDNLLANIQRFKEVNELYQQSIKLHKNKLLEQKNNEIHIPVFKLQKSEPLHTITWEIIKDFSFTSAQVNEVIKLLTAENGSYVNSNSHRIIRNRNWLIIAPLQTAIAENILIEKSDKNIHFENGFLLLEQFAADKTALSKSDMVATLNASEIRFPLLLRKWKQGDYFYPLGMQKKKKLSKFFIDKKLSKTDKEKVWVIESNKKILWVVGYRIDDRFKINEQTKNVIAITYKPLQ